MSNRVSVGHSEVGSSKRGGARETASSLEQSADKARDIVSGAQDVFDKLDEEAQAPQEEASPKTLSKLQNLRELAFLGKLKKTIHIGGFNFEIATLNAEEQREVLYELMKFPKDKRALYTQLIILTKALRTINSVPIGQAVVEAGFEDIKSFIYSIQGSIVEKLYDDYESLVAESKSVFEEKKESKELLKD